MRRYDSDIAVRDIPFNRATFWVQVHDMLVRFMNKTVAESFCDTVGIVCCSTGGTDEEGGSFMRVKVTLDVSLPLCKGRLISLENCEKCWVSFKYKRLPNICYWCGCLDHDDKDCSLWIRSKGTLSPSQKQYS